jgi:hypothetical protein
VHGNQLPDGKNGTWDATLAAAEEPQESTKDCTEFYRGSRQVALNLKLLTVLSQKSKKETQWPTEQNLEK